MPCFIKIDRVYRIGTLHKAIDNQQLRHDIKSPAGMSTESFHIGQSGKKHQAVTNYLDIVEQNLTLYICQASLLQIIFLGRIFT